MESNNKMNSMTPGHRILLTCKSVAHVLEPLAGSDIEVRIMEIALHINPQKLRSHLMTEISSIEKKGSFILLGYGLCGRSLEGVVSAKSTLVLPRVDDCVGALLGSRHRHKELMKQRAGCYFIEENWLDTELNIFSETLKGLERIPPERRSSIARMALENYTTLALLDSGDTTPAADAMCADYADEYGLDFMRLRTDLGLLTRLMNGPWPEEEFIVCPPGRPIPFF